MKTVTKIIFTIIFLSMAIYSETATVTEDTFYNQLKNVLNYNREYKMKIQIATFNGTGDPLVRTYTVYTKNQGSLLVTEQPLRDKGQLLLILNDQIWQYFPKIRKTMNINTALTINGSLNINDIISSTVFQFYQKSGYQFVSGENIHIFTFTAMSTRSPYGKLVYYFKDNKITGVDAYARSGIKMKKIVFLQYNKNEDGSEYPSRIKIINLLKENDHTLIQMSAMENIQVPDFYFNPSAMENIREN